MDIPNRAPWVNVAVGVLTILSPFVAVPASSFAKWDMTITGCVIGIIAIVELAAYGKTARMTFWPVLNILAGIWLFISTTWLSGNIALIWSNIVLGVITIVSALVALSYERMHETHRLQPPTRTHMGT
jgi:hypothetical protein